MKKDCKDCEHGICLGPNICVCVHGRDGPNCLSFCESKCSNGHCENGKCQCNNGFQKNLHRLKLYDEYDYDDDDSEECQPICEKCTNGKCLSPNECQCNEGFKKGGYSNLCLPVCSNCTNGICVAPERCACAMGYKSSNGTCIPQCYGNCPADKCIGPGFCDCGEGFKWSYFTERCIAQCIVFPCKEKEQCMASTTGKCECKTGYKRNMMSLECEPICDEECVNGYCSEPNTCSCKQNFTHKNNTFCEPKCEPICPRFSECMTDGSCKCNEGYTNSSFGLCLKVCECVNGFCDVDSNGCVCNPGYRPNPKNATECLTKCEVEGCENGFCDKGGECTCHTYYKKDTITGKCVKCEEGSMCNGEYVPYKCDPPCQHGLCIKKDICSCHHGYDRTAESHVCEPICHGGCVNGVCGSPHNCTCNEGYEKVDTKCQPVCDHQCINGICSAPNTCSCTDGHEFVHNSTQKCEKIKCHHGDHHKGHKDCHPGTEGSSSDHSAEPSTGEEGNGVWFM